MMLQLHPNARARLIELVANGIMSLQTRNGMFVDTASALDLVNADNALDRAVRDQLLAYIGDLPLVTFITDLLDDELRTLNQFLVGTPFKKLTDIDGYGDVKQVAERFVTQLVSLPWQYSLT
jgi:hypothetical protein